jgi:sulfatase modifying factor 1
VAWTDSNSEGTTLEVGGLSPNGWGLYDMSGNLGEWTGDWYGGSVYSRGDSVDPVGDSDGTDRVTRGGSWPHNRTHARVAYRKQVGIAARSVALGFRLARTNP